MTDRWTEEQLRYFLHVRSGLMKTGFSRDVAEAQARRTIEKRMRQGGSRRRTEGDTKDDLYQEAKRFNITGRSKMDKEQLAKAVQGHRNMTRGQ